MCFHFAFAAIHGIPPRLHFDVEEILQHLREEAGLPWLTPHCFRHMAITAMLENGAAPETLRHIAGHVSEQMMRHYSHNRLEAQITSCALIDHPGH